MGKPQQKKKRVQSDDSSSDSGPEDVRMLHKLVYQFKFNALNFK